MWTILRELAAGTGVALATRVQADQAREVQRRLGRAFTVTHDALARTVTVVKKGTAVLRSGGEVAILAAGTADVPVAEEARITAELMGCRAYRHYDVGVAGIHRLLGIGIRMRLPAKSIRQPEAARRLHLISDTRPEAHSNITPATEARKAVIV